MRAVNWRGEEMPGNRPHGVFFFEHLRQDRNDMRPARVPAA